MNVLQTLRTSFQRGFWGSQKDEIVFQVRKPKTDVQILVVSCDLSFNSCTNSQDGWLFVVVLYPQVTIWQDGDACFVLQHIATLDFSSSTPKQKSWFKDTCTNVTKQFPVTL